MRTAHKEEWLKKNNVVISKEFDNDYKNIISILRSSSLEQVESKVKRYLNSNKKRWTLALTRVWSESGRATIELMENFFTGKSYGFSTQKRYTKTIGDIITTWDRRVSERVNTSFQERIVGINKATEDSIHRVIADGLEHNRTLEEVSAKIEEKLTETWPSRGETIARTEGNSAINAATLEDARATIPGRMKVWVCQFDNSRPAHEEADGQAVAMDDPFIVDGEELDCPCDDGGSPGNIINCNCDMYFEDEGDIPPQEEPAPVEAPIEIPVEDVRTAAETLYQNAAEIEKETTDTLSNIADATNGKLDNLDFRLKTEDSTARKIAGYLEENPKLTVEEAAERVTDSLRYTMIYDEETLTESVLKSQDMLRSDGLEPFDHKLRNYFGKYQDEGYQGYNTVWTDAQGNKFELQYHTSESLRIKEENHVIYRTYQLEKDPAVKQSLRLEMDNNWAKFKPPTNYEKLPALR